MKKQLISILILIVSTCCLVALLFYNLFFELIINHEIVLAFFPLFYLLLGLRYLQVFGMKLINNDNAKSSIKNNGLVVRDPFYIVISFLLAIIFASFLKITGWSVISISLILLFSLVLYNSVFFYFPFRVNHILYFINLYIFMIAIILNQVNDYLISNYNPFGSLFPYILQ